RRPGRWRPTSGWPCAAPKARSRRLETSAVHLLDRQGIQVHPLEAAHVDRERRLALAILAAAERADAAHRAELVADAVLVEGVGGQRVLRRLQVHLRGREEREQVAAPAADRAIA